jgi:membrane protease YdiL (CAAX protease family)
VDVLIAGAAWAAARVAAGAWVDVARSALTLLAVPLLFRALRDEQEAPGARDVLRRGFFALLGAAVLFTFTSRWTPEPRPGDEGGGFEAFVRGSLSYRLGFTHLAQAARRSAAGQGAATHDLREAARKLPESAYIQRYLGIALAAEGALPESRSALARAVEVLAQRAPERAQRERAIWQRLFGPVSPAPAEIEVARREIERLGLGWIGRVAVLAAYQRLGENAVPRELRRAVVDEATRFTYRYTVLGFGMVLLMPQLGLVFLVVGMVLAANGVLRPAPREHRPTSAPLWEAFILMLALGVAPLSLFLGGQRPSPETQPGVVAALIVASDLLQTLALGYLWWRLRTRGLSLAEIGLHRRHFWSNVGIGAASATILMPAAVIIGLVTQQISDRIFPNVAPPYHPLGGMTATSTSLEIRLALFTAAAVGAPLLEEIFFRGCLFGALRRRMGFWAALLGSSAFFAVLHPQLPLGFLPIAVLGGAFAALYEWRQSLVPGIVAHAINNGLIFLLLTVMFPRA